MVHGMASVTFAVECGKTRPGEAVYVVGNHESLGNWSPARAVPLTTSAETFPLWCSSPVPLPAGKAVEFKFVIAREPQTVSWENFTGNRVVEAAPGSMITVRSAWDDVKSTTTNTVCSSHVVPPSPKGLVREGGGALKKTISGNAIARAEMETWNEEMAEREPMRRNFSQSLFHSTEGGGSEEGKGEHVQGKGTIEIIQTPVGDDSGEHSHHTRGVSLQHVTSFSALTEMADVETKGQVRQKRKAEYQPFNTDVPVVIVTSELAPWSKSGGLGLVAASYSYEFARNGHRTMAIAPKYQHYDDIKYAGETRAKVDGREELVKYWHKYMDFGDGSGCDYIFVDHPSIERAGGLYNGEDGREYGDNLFRFTLLSSAALEAPLALHLGGFPYGDKVVFLANDWQAGLVPLYLSYKYRRHGRYSQARCIYVVHNLGYQGQYPHVNACHFFGIDHQAACDVAFGDCVNLTKGALICADRVLTVSPNYAWEIQTKEGGFGLDGFVRGKAHSLRLSGVLNGIDDYWNPETDVKIAKNYGVEDFQAGKRINKDTLQRMLGLRADPGAVLVGFVGRLTWQKGVDVLAEVLSWLMEDTGNGVTGRVQLIMMGNGEERYANTLRWAEATFSGRVCGYVGFDPAVEHQMMAGCDLLLMPSRYEPCGLPQMYAQQYGTLPIVAATGGLVDSVTDVSEGLDVATGFHIPYMTADRMKEVLYKAMEMYFRRPDAFKRMQRTAMLRDFYWPKAMDQYEQNIDYTLYDPPQQR